MNDNKNIFSKVQIVGESKKRCKTLEPVEVPEIVKLIIDNTKSKAKKRKRNFNEEQKRNIVELDKIDEGKFLKSQLKEEIDQIRRQIHHKERTDNQLISIVQNLSIIAKKVLPSPKAEEKYMNHAKIQNSQIYLDVTTFDPSRGLSYQVNNKSTNSKIPQFPTLYSTDSQRNQVQIYTDDIDQSNSNQSLELSKQKQSNILFSPAKHLDINTRNQNQNYLKIERGTSQQSSSSSKFLSSQISNFKLKQLFQDSQGLFSSTLLHGKKHKHHIEIEQPSQIIQKSFGKKNLNEVLDKFNDQLNQKHGFKTQRNLNHHHYHFGISMTRKRELQEKEKQIENLILVSQNQKSLFNKDIQEDQLLMTQDFNQVRNKTNYIMANREKFLHKIISQKRYIITPQNKQQ